MLPEEVRVWVASALALSDDAQFVVDARGNVMLLNEPARQLLAGSQVEPVGRPLDSAFVLHESAGGAELPVTALQDGGGSGQDALLTLHGQVGFPVRVHRRSVGPAERPLGFVLRVQDLSAKKRTLETERLTREESERAQAREAVSIFMGGVGNQLRNGMQIITGHAEMIADGVASEKARRLSAAAIRRTSQRVFALITRMIDFAQSRSAEPRLVDLADAVIEASPGLRAGLPENVQLVTSLNVASCPVRIDPRGIETVLRVLIDNAREAMPGGGTITVSVDETPLDASQATPSSSGASAPGPVTAFALRVSDTGAGIAPDVQKHLFEPFYTTRKADGAAGLGLAQLADVITMAGGRVEFTSEVGRGTEFSAILPRAGTTLLPSATTMTRAFPTPPTAPLPGSFSSPAAVAPPSPPPSSASSPSPRASSWPSYPTTPSTPTPPMSSPSSSTAPSHSTASPSSGARSASHRPPSRALSFKLGGAPSSPTSTGPTILVVDDEPDLLILAADRLRADGYTVLTAELGPVALSIAREHPGRIDLMITDVFMPGMRGNELASELWKIRPETRVLYMTGDVAALGSTKMVIQKPFPMSVFSTVVREALGNG